MNMGRNHIRMMCPKHIRVSVNGTGVIPPFLLVGKRSHVVANTEDFLLGQLHVLRQEHDGFITVTLEERFCVVYPFVGVIDGVAVLVDFAEVVKHTDDVRATGISPFKTIFLGKLYEQVHHHKGMVE